MEQWILPGDGVPGDVCQIEDEVFGLVVFWPAKNLGPVLKIRPGLLGCAPAERRETGQKLEENTAQRPVVDRVGVWFPSQYFRRHVIR